MSEINYVIGDATRPIGSGKKIIAQVNNTLGGWGAGFVISLSRRWKQPEAVYRSTPVKDLKLGNVQFVNVEPDITVANMIAQEGIGFSPDGKPPIRYGALRVALNEVNDMAYHTGATIHMPRIGAGLGGGDWKIIEQIIKEVMSVDVYVYDLKKNFK